MAAGLCNADLGGANGRQNASSVPTNKDLKVLFSSPYRGEGEEAWQPDYATLTWVVQHSLRLAAPCVLGEQQRKAMFLKTLVMLITGPASRVTDAAVLMEVLAIVRKWLIDPPPSAGARHPCPTLLGSPVTLMPAHGR